MLQVLCHETRILVYAQNKMQTHRDSGDITDDLRHLLQKEASWKAQ
jgi:hypothetical protein